MGGISFGTGIALIVLTPIIVLPSLFNIVILVGAVSIFAGVLNIVASARKID